MMRRLHYTLRDSQPRRASRMPPICSSRMYSGCGQQMLQLLEWSHQLASSHRQLQPTHRRQRRSQSSRDSLCTRVAANATSNGANPTTPSSPSHREHRHAMHLTLGSRSRCGSNLGSNGPHAWHRAVRAPQLLKVPGDVRADGKTQDYGLKSSDFEATSDDHTCALTKAGIVHRDQGRKLPSTWYALRS